MSDDWRPGASIESVRARARLLNELRAFFAARDILEVETPLLGRATVTDPNVASLSTRLSGEPRELYLQTSPEYAMKRLLAAGSGSIFQICKAFRDGEHGRLHSPEFTLLEWYRPGFDHHALMDEVDRLVQAILGTTVAHRLSYSEAFRTTLELDPHTVSTEALRGRVSKLGLAESTGQELERDACLELLMSVEVQPALGKGAVFVYDFPASQASLARLREGAPPVAERFELFVDGIELANGFAELTDVREQASRFEADLKRRRERGLVAIPLDRRLLAALSQGLPECAGVALGVDRLLLLATNAQELERVLLFPVLRS